MGTAAEGAARGQGIPPNRPELARIPPNTFDTAP